LSAETTDALLGICKEDYFKKNELLQKSGETARYYYFIKSGLVGYYTIDEDGEQVYKLFFAEKAFLQPQFLLLKMSPEILVL
jgi:CRP-like cAMP-binding protein